MDNSWPPPPYAAPPPDAAGGGWPWLQSGPRLSEEWLAVLSGSAWPQPDVHATAGHWLSGDPVERAKAATFQVRTASGAGSAFYIDNDEWLTNCHVVEDAARAELAHGDMRLFAAVDIRLPWCDLALLRARTPVWVPPLRLAASRPADLANVTVVGFPSGVSGTPSATRGVVLGYAPLPGVLGGVWLETYAYMGLGNSGGPIVDDYGEVVGIVTRGRGLRNRHYIEGFAVAAETIKAQLDLLRLLAIAAEYVR